MAALPGMWDLNSLTKNQRAPPAMEIVIVQSLSHVQLFATLWTAAHQASLSITNSRSHRLSSCGTQA